MQAPTQVKSSEEKVQTNYVYLLENILRQREMWNLFPRPGL